MLGAPRAGLPDESLQAFEEVPDPFFEWRSSMMRSDLMEVVLNPEMMLLAVIKTFGAEFLAWSAFGFGSVGSEFIPLPSRSPCSEKVHRRRGRIPW